MTRLLLGLLVASLPLSSGCFRHSRHAMHGDNGMGDPPWRSQERPWPMVRIQEPIGALVVMERGVFGEGLSATAPLEGRFQPTAQPTAAGHPLELRFEGAHAQRLGGDKPFVIYARLNVRESHGPQGTLVLAPSECALRALVDGDLDELHVEAETLPTAEEACRAAAAPATGTTTRDCPMGAGQACPMHAGQGCPMHAGQGCPMHARAGGKHGCGTGRCSHGGRKCARAAAELTLRMTKF